MNALTDAPREGEVEVIQSDWDAAIRVCLLTGWQGVALRLAEGWRPSAGTKEYQLAARIARTRLASTPTVQQPGDASSATARSVFPDRIGQLQLGEKLSDGEERMCAGGCDMLIPAGHAIYWPERMGEYPDDIDRSCIACAIAKTESEQGWCDRCDDPESARSADRRSALTSSAQQPGAGEVQHGLGRHATVIEDGPDGFMPVALLVGENVYLQQADAQIFLSREQAASVAAALANSGDTA